MVILTHNNSCRRRPTTAETPGAVSASCKTLLTHTTATATSGTRRSVKLLSAIHSTFLVGGGPCVVLAAPGMLQSGLSRELFEYWCGDSRNGVVLTGYSVRVSLYRELYRDIVNFLCMVLLIRSFYY